MGAFNLRVTDLGMFRTCQQKVSLTEDDGRVPITERALPMPMKCRLKSGCELTLDKNVLLQAQSRVNHTMLV